MTSTSRIEELLTRFIAHDRIALARLITMVENRADGVGVIMERVYPMAGRAVVIGITGAPGAGKSTLVNRLIAHLRQRGQRVAVLAIDPSSPFSGGAVLGDRVRMTDHYRDDAVYIRSVSSRGSHGGLSRAAREIVHVLDAFGHDVVIIETVGVGQTELGVMDLADTTVVVTVPEGGDGVQAMKAGLNEIADVFVVNKADRAGADRIKAELELEVHLRNSAGWHPPVIMTEATADRGVDALLEAIDRHAEYLAETRDPARLAERRVHEFVDIVTAEIERRTARALGDGAAPELLDRIRTGELNPYRAARELMEHPGTLVRVLATPAHTPVPGDARQQERS
jgi:LAO/AO transport system kinase